MPKNLSISLSLPEGLDVNKTVDTIASKIKNYDAGIQLKIQSLDSLIWDRSKGILYDEAGNELALSEVERIIIQNLARKLNSFMSYEELLSALRYANHETTETTLRVYIHRLRKKLGYYQEIIVTRRNVGISLRDSDGRISLR